MAFMYNMLHISRWIEYKMRRSDLFPRPAASTASKRQNELKNALEALILEKTQLFILQEVYKDQPKTMAPLPECLPDIAFLASQLSIERGMPRLKDTYTSLQDSSPRGNRAEARALNELLTAHRIRFISKLGEIEQKFF